MADRVSTFADSAFDLPDRDDYSWFPRNIPDREHYFAPRQIQPDREDPAPIRYFLPDRVEFISKASHDPDRDDQSGG